MRCGLVAVLLMSVTPVFSAEAPRDPVSAFLASYSAPEAPEGKGERLAKVQSDLLVAAAGLETFRAPFHADRSRDALLAVLDSSLKPFFKDRDASLDTIYRTLAVVDYTWASRLPDAPCAPADKRAAMLRSPDGLFSSTPWIAELMGAAPGSSAAEALDRASSETKIGEADYERLRVRASRLTVALNSERAVGPSRAKLYCQRAEAFVQLASAHRVAAGPALAGRTTSMNDGSSVLLIAAAEGANYRALGTAVVVKTDKGDRVLTDASLLQGHDKFVLFSRPSSGKSVGAPVPFVLERAASGFGPAIGHAEGAVGPGLPLATAPAAQGAMIRGIGHLNATGPWTETRGLVTAVGDGAFQADAIVSEDMAGAPLFDDTGSAVGLVVLQDGQPVALTPAALKQFVDGGAFTAKADTTILAARGTGSASLIEAGLPSNLGGVNWEGGGGVGNWKPHTSAGPPADYKSYQSNSSGSSSHSSGSSSYESDWGSRAGTAMGDSLGEALGEVAVMGMKALFNGIASMFQPRQQGAPAVTRSTTQPAAPKPPPPPPKIPLKVSGMTLSANPIDAAPGQGVDLTATVHFTGEAGTKAKIKVSFLNDSDLVEFVNGSAAETNEEGVAVLHVVVRGNAATEAEDSHEDLSREERRQAGETAAPQIRVQVDSKADAKTKTKGYANGALDKLDAEADRNAESETKTPVITEAGAGLASMGASRAIVIGASIPGAATSVTLNRPRVAMMPEQPPDCADQINRLYPQEQAAQNERQVAMGLLKDILKKYGISFESFESVFPKLLMNSEGVCEFGDGPCQLHANAQDWALAQASYGHYQAQEKKARDVSAMMTRLRDRCGSPQENEEKESADNKRRGSEGVGDNSGSDGVWADPETLADHFRRHGKDFDAKDPKEYVRLAKQFLERAEREGLPRKIDKDGSILAYDREQNIFGSYWSDGSIRTFFKPNVTVHKRPTNWDYWLDQRGVSQ